ncbi:MAG: class I SAM-dependent rRNA methyltransferase [Syntrophales bacterium]
MTDYPQLVLKEGRERSLVGGHPWLFSGAVAKIKGRPEPGEIVVATTAEGQPLALGFYNTQSDIAFRMLTRDVAATVDQEFWQRQLRDAAALRKRILPPDTTAFRLINAEGDGMPGLVVDRYGDYLVMVVSTAGMERRRETVIEALVGECRPLGILERSDGPSRRLEGLTDRTGWVWGEEAPEGISIRENGLAFEVDIITGQKTGFFLDQRDNRSQIGSLSNGLSVLNCFSYTGAFSVYAARGGANRVVSVDASEPANIAARRHLEQNGLSPEAHPVLKGDVFQYLRKTEESFDLIILDPPAFAKSRREVQHAARGYKDINLQAFRRLAAGGILATFSCSNAVDEALFEKIVLGAARDAGKTVRLLKKLAAAPDHPTSLAHSEGRYLKGLLVNALP